MDLSSFFWDYTKSVMGGEGIIRRRVGLVRGTVVPETQGHV